MPTSAPTSPQLAVYAKLLCLLMVVICGAAAPMEEKVRLFSVKTKGFMEASRKGPVVSARNVTFSKFTNLTIRSTNEIGVVELVFADLTPQRRLCMDKFGKLKGMKKLASKRRQPGCLFRECVDDNYFFYLTTHHRPRLVGFHGREQFNPLGPPRCCDLTRGPVDLPEGLAGLAGPDRLLEDSEHLVPDGDGRYSCQRRRAPHHQSDYFFFLKKRQENATVADTIPVHNHRQGGHNRDRLAGPPAGPLPEPHHNRHHGQHPRRSSSLDSVGGSDLSDVDEQHQQHQQLRRAKHHRGASAGTTTTTTTTTSTTTTSTTTPVSTSRHHHQQQQRQQQRQQKRRQQQQQQRRQQQHKEQELDQRPHRTRHHHHLTPMWSPPLQQQLPARTPRPAVRVRHRKVGPGGPGGLLQDAGRASVPSINHLPWD